MLVPTKLPICTVASGDTLPPPSRIELTKSTGWPLPPHLR